jgi:signal peptidase I, bacterial type
MAREELEILNSKDLRAELAREEAKYRLRKTLLNVVGVLVVVAATTTLVATRVLSLLQVNGSSMAPTFADGEYVILLQTKDVETGDIIGFHYGGEVLLKRIIGGEGDFIEIDQDGTVSVNGRELEETYLTEKTLGKCQLEFPYEVPDGMLFVMGDNRAVSMDSRLRTIGCVEKAQIMGRVVCIIWPWDRMEMIH